MGLDGCIPLEGGYEPSPEAWVRNQVDTYEASAGTEANTLRGKPIVILTTRGARSGSCARRR